MWRTLVSTVGTLPPAWLGAAAVAAWCPIDPSAQLAVGFVSTLPLWVAAMCLASLDRRAWRSALAALLATGLALAALALR